MPAHQVRLGLWVLAALACAALSQAQGRAGRIAPEPWDARLAQARTLDINAADGAELARLPEIGPVLADRILAYRQEHGRFARLDQLLEVSGIGPNTLDAVRAYVAIE